MSSIRGRHGTSFKIIDAEELTISGLGTTDDTICDGVRNNTGSAGNIKVVLDNKDGTNHTFKNVNAGEEVYANIRQVLETGTTLATVEKFWLE